MIPLLVLVWFHINGSDLQCFKCWALFFIGPLKKKKRLYFIFFFSLPVSLQERMALSLMQRRQAARPAERATPIRHLPTRLWRCWVVCWWCCASPPPGWVPLRWLSWPSSPSPVPFSSPGSVVTGTSSFSPSTTPDTLFSHGRSRPPYKNSGKVSAKLYLYPVERCFVNNGPFNNRTLTLLLYVAPAQIVKLMPESIAVRLCFQQQTNHPTVAETLALPTGPYSLFQWNKF